MALAVGSHGGHVIVRKGDANSTVYYDDQIGVDGKVNHRERLPFPIGSMLGLAVGPQNEPHLLYWGLNGDQDVLSYASVANGKWFNQTVPNPGCGFFESSVDSFGWIVVDAANHAYIPCVWQQTSGVNFASLIVFDGSNWSREDAATDRFDDASAEEIGPVGNAFAAVDGKNAVHLAYGLMDAFYDLLAICDSVRQQGTYTENCDSTQRAYRDVSSMAVGPAGDPHFIYGDGSNEFYLHADGSSLTNEPVNAINLAVDSNDIPATAYIGLGLGVINYAVRTPNGWQTQVTVTGPIFPFGLQIAMNSAAGLPYLGSTVEGEFSPIHEGFYVFESAPDPTASWNDIALTTTGRPKLLAHLQVLNDGNAAANGYNITFLLSDTSTASASDPVLGKATVSLAPGASRILTFDFDPAKAPSGKYIVAQIATKPGEANPNNNTAAIMIP